MINIENNNIIRYWLYIVLVLCLLIVMVGGATRLTGSGLSITEWKPIHGVIPPLTQCQWQDEFVKYQNISQYTDLNKGMSLDQFKMLFWWEWSHRMLARIIGLVSLLPLLCYGFLPGLKQKYLKYFIIVPIIVGIQGVIGWWMVYSGLAGSKLTSVSQYRLAIHMLSASLIIMLITYLSQGLVKYKTKAATVGLQKFAAMISFAILIQIYLGALVAGLHAGLSYNSWPLMDGSFVPDGLFILQPVWHNFFENLATVQFTHRCWAYLVFTLVFINLIYARCLDSSVHFRRSVILFILIFIQMIIGIFTLLYSVPIFMGLIHQFFALVVFVFSVMHWRACKASS